MAKGALAHRLLLLEAGLPKYHISTAWAKRSGANAWASAHALSMVTWYHQKIVNGYCLFEPLLLRVLIMNLQIVSLIFCHSALQMLFDHYFVLYTSQVDRILSSWNKFSPCASRSRSACVKHGHVVPSKNCCWPVLGYVHPWNFGSKENLNTEWCLDAVHPICQSVGVSFCPTHAFCPPIIHISQNPNSKSFHCPCLLACVPSTNFTDLW